MEIREIYYSQEYEEYYKSLDEKTQEKFDYVEYVIRNIKVVNKKFVKNLENTEFYEARISLGNNEYRTIVFAIDANSFVECQKVLFLNSFLKKDTKQYRKEVDKASRIIKKYMEE